MNTELWLIHSIAGSNKHGKSAKDNCITDMPGINIRKQSLEQDNNMLQEQIIVTQGMS